MAASALLFARPILLSFYTAIPLVRVVFTKKENQKMLVPAVLSTLAAWFVGLLLDANLDFGEPQGFLCLRILFPLVVMGCFVLRGQRKEK